MGRDNIAGIKKGGIIKNKNSSFLKKLCSQLHFALFVY